MPPHKTSLPTQRFVPVMDWWVASFIVLLLVILVAAIPLIVWQPIPNGSKVLAALGLILISLYLLDLSLFTSYYLAPEELIVVSQLRRYVFSYRSMREIRPGGLGGLISTPGKKRFSLSANCLIIQLHRGAWKRITVSPKRRQEFIDQLLKRIDSERSGRASVSRHADA